MKKIEKLFDINIVLMTLSSSLETIRDEKHIELIYDMDATIPKELRGDPTVLQHLLTQVLTFVCRNTDLKEIVLSLSAPEDFVYEEPISFKIKKTNIPRGQIQTFLETNLAKDLEKLDGKIIYDKDADIHIDIPFIINELGFRRHYRLPSVSMMGKKALLVCESPKVAKSIEKMFKYFLYDVDVGLDAYKAQGNNLTPYDILIIEDKYNSEELEHIIAKLQQHTPLKYVLLQDDHHVEHKTISVSTHLIKPVTEESVFELIISLFKNERDTKAIKEQAKENIVDLEKILHVHKNNEKYINPSTQYQENLQTMIEKKRGLDLPILDTKVGEENTKKMGLKYSNELKSFIDTFAKSDLYFRQIVNEQATNKIKEFCVDLEKNAKLIGAESILKLAETVNLIFVYNKLDLLPIYPGKYHIELQKLIKEIKKELKIK
jgi:hypothetical protein